VGGARGGALSDDDVAPAIEQAAATPESRRERLARYAQATRSRTDALRRHAADHMERLEDERSHRPLVDVVLSVRDVDDRLAGRELSAAVAYRLFFLMLPLLLLAVGGIGLAAASDRGATSDAVRSSGTTAAVAKSIADATGELSVLEHLVVLGIGVFGTYFAARGLMKTLARVHAGAWEVPFTKTPRGFRAAGIVLGLVVALVVLSQEWNQLKDRLGALEFLLALPVVGLVYAVLIGVMHAQLPRPADATWHRLVPGALLVGLSIAALQAFVLGYIARKLSSSSELYGGVGTAIVVLFWLYLLGRVLVVGAVLDGVLWRRRDGAESVR
jgi:membrane protein